MLQNDQRKSFCWLPCYHCDSLYAVPCTFFASLFLREKNNSILAPLIPSVRLQTLLLIAHIASMAKRLIGEAAKAQQLELQLTSNNIKKRNTISVMTLAQRVIERPDLLRKVGDAWQYLATLRRQATTAVSGAVERV